MENSFSTVPPTIEKNTISLTLLEVHPNVSAGFPSCLVLRNPELQEWLPEQLKLQTLNPELQTRTLNPNPQTLNQASTFLLARYGQPALEKLEANCRLPAQGFKVSALKLEVLSLGLGVMGLGLGPSLGFKV